MANLYLSLGTNLGDRQSNLKTALAHIGQKIGTVLAVSDIMETEPWGFYSPNSFLNVAAKVQTGLDPADVLPMYMEAAGYVIGVANEKLKKLPNAEAEEGE